MRKNIRLVDIAVSEDVIDGVVHGLTLPNLTLQRLVYLTFTTLARFSCSINASPTAYKHPVFSLHLSAHYRMSPKVYFLSWQFLNMQRRMWLIMLFLLMRRYFPSLSPRCHDPRGWA